MMKNIAVFVSGGGTNLQALIDAQARGEITGGKIALVVSSSPKAYALERAERADIPAAIIPRKVFDSQEQFDAAILETLAEKNLSLIHI